MPRHDDASRYALPPRLHNAAGTVRGVGLEVEIAKLSLERTLEVIARCLGGTTELDGRTQGAVRGTLFGDFKVELDHSLLHSRSYLRPLERLGLIDGPDSDAARRLEASIVSLAAEIIPIEVVTPPLPCDRLAELDVLWGALRAAGAADTHGSLLYAFGLHLNPEVPDATPETLLAYLRAFLLLEDWIAEVSRIDVSRRLSPFVKDFSETYRRTLLAPDYAPSARQLVDDYLAHNPTRNRTLDMLPLFVHLHGPQLLEQVDEAKLVKPRPTFHYRLPNCELAGEGWTPAADWNRWVAIERLAASPALLAELAAAYLGTLDLPLRLQRAGWVETLRARVTLPGEPVSQPAP